MTTHGIYCERRQDATDDLVDRGIEVNGWEDPVLQFEIQCQIEWGLECSCAAATEHKGA